MSAWSPDLPLLRLQRRSGDGPPSGLPLEIIPGRCCRIEAIEKLVRETPADYIILSYSSGGRATARELHDVLNSYGRIVGAEKINYRKNVMSTMKWTRDWVKDTEEDNYEYLFLMEKNTGAAFLEAPPRHAAAGRA